MQELDAQILILIEESAVALFSAFPDHFILFGGVTLVLFHDSPRLSRDLDLLSSSGQLPEAKEIQAVVRDALQPIAETLGLGQIEFRQGTVNAGLAKQWVSANQRPLFSIDLTTIGGNVLNSQIVKHIIAGIPEKSVLAPNANYLLYQKCETFLSRRHVKGRDAFDIHLLLSRDAILDNTLRPHFEDFLRMREFDAEFIEERIQSVTPKLCTVELRPVLPLPLFEELESRDFLPIHSSLRTVFSEWIEELQR
jgi:Nucleotidyl transferase AbiEii toxin, Type IV TA system